MHPILKKTFGGLSPNYYFRHFFFGILLALFFSMLFLNKSTSGLVIYAYLLISTCLYPYSRFVYESVVNFIVGNNMFILNALVMLFCKAFTMLACWGLSILIAPIGLIYLYFHHSKDEVKL